MKRLASGIVPTGAVIVAFLALAGFGCADGSAAQPAGKSAESPTEAPRDLEKLLGAWPDDATPSTEAVERFVELAHRADWEGALRVSDLSEGEFISIPEDQRTEVLERLLKRFGRLRALAGAAMERAEALRDRGDTERAGAYVEAVRRAGQANASEDLTPLSQMVGESILKLAVEFDRANQG